MRSSRWLIALALGGCSCEPARSPPIAADSATVAPAPSAIPSSSAASASPTASAPAKPAFASRPPDVVPSRYAPLFEHHRVWKLTTKVTAETRDDGKPHRTSAASTATCKVEEVTRADFGISSSISCAGLDANGPENPLSGVWVATRDGVFHFASARDLDPSALVRENAYAALEPEEGKVERSDPNQKDFSSRVLVEKHGAAICVEHVESAGDDAWTRLCFEPGVGPRSGAYGWAGGSTHETTFEAR